MEKISPRLKEKIHAAESAEEPSFNLIISFFENADWDEGVCLVQEAGLRIDSKVEEIRIVSGRAKITAIHRIEKVSAVKLIEMDELGLAMD